MKHPLLANDYRLPTTEKINRKTFDHLLNENLITIRLFRLIFGNIDEHFITQFYDPSKCRIHPTIREKNGKKKYIILELNYSMTNRPLCPLCLKFTSIHFNVRSRWKLVFAHYLQKSHQIIILLCKYYCLDSPNTHSILSIFQSNSFLFLFLLIF